MKLPYGAPYVNGIGGQKRVLHLLVRYGRKVSMTAYKGPFDLLVDDAWRVEVKTAKSHRRGGDGTPIWCFNLQRHGKLAEQTDWYVLRMEKVPFCSCAVHLLLRAPVRRATVTISIRSLLNGQFAWAQDFKRFARGEMPAPTPFVQEAA